MSRILTVGLSEEAVQATVTPVPVIEVVAPEPVRPTPQIASVPAAVESAAVPNGMKGKRSNADYMQVNVYLKKETTHKAKIALLQSMDERDFSELMQDLLSGWVSQAKS